jgi:hypothetical protein
MTKSRDHQAILGVLRGTQVVARKSLAFDTDTDRDAGPVWSEDGRYVVAIDHTNKNSGLPGNTSDHTVAVIDVRNGAVRTIACPGCTTVVALGGSTILASIDPEFSSGEAAPPVYGDPDKLPMMEIDLGTSSPAVQLVTDLPTSVGPVDFVAGSAGQVLVAGKSDAVTPQALFLLRADGSVKAFGTTSSRDLIGPVTASVPDAAGAVRFAINGDWLEAIPNQEGGNITILNSMSGERSVTDTSTLASMADIQAGGTQVHVLDLWFSANGLLCGSLSVSKGYGHGSDVPFTQPVPASRWCVTDNRWRKVKTDRLLFDRSLNLNASAVVVPSDSSEIDYSPRLGGTLYTDISGVRTFVASDVVTVAAPRSADA